MASRAARKRPHPVPPLRGEDRQAWRAAIVDSSFDAIIGQTPAGTITSWNAGAEQIYGYAAQEVLGRSIEIVVPPHRIGEWRAAYRRVRRGKHVEPFETERVTKEGRLLAVLHEPTINAAKHGALASATGRIEIAAQVLSDMAGQRRLALTWTERGGPRRARQPARGFGATMIEQGLAYQLGGEATLELASEGVRCAIEFPLAEAHRPLDLPGAQAIGDGDVTGQAV